MKDSIGFIVLFAVLAVFGLWQMDRANGAVAESIKKDTRLKVQAETIKAFEELGEKIDKALETRSKAHDAIDKNRQITRQKTRETARKEPELAEHLATPLHPALRPGGGLLGRKNDKGADDTRLAPAADPGP